MDEVGPHFMTKITKKERRLISSTIVNCTVNVRLLMWQRSCYNLAGPCGQATKVHEHILTM
jgi:hypothetical protein